MISVTMSELTAVVGKLASLAAERSTLDILKCLRLEASGGLLRIKASNLDIEAEGSLLCEGDMPAVAVNSQRFFAVVKTAEKQARISITSEGGRLKICAGRSKWDLPSLPAEEFPAMMAVDLKDGPCGDASIWRCGFSTTRPSQSNEIHRHYLCGTYLHGDDGGVAFVSTQGTSLHKFTTDSLAPAIDEGIIIPSALTATLLSALPDKGNVQAAYSDRLVRFTWDGWVVTGKLVEGSFPRYQRVIPQRSQTRITFDVKQMLVSVGGVLPIAEHREKRLKLTVKDDRIVIENLDRFSGSASSEMPMSIEGFESEFSFGLNGRILSDLLSSLGCETAFIDGADLAPDMKPVGFNPTVPNGVCAVIHPMRL